MYKYNVTSILCLLLIAALSVTGCKAFTGNGGNDDELPSASTTVTTTEDNTKNDIENTDFEKNDVSDLIAILHAGGGADDLSYINAQETFLYYYELGYRYFEYDLKLSSDGRLIGTHDGEGLDVCDFSDITYDEFKTLRLSNGYTPVNEEWLMDTIINYPDVRIVVDAKMPTTEEDVLVLQRLEKLEKIYDCDISANIIPEVFSVDMWNILKETTTFDKYFYSRYKVCYSVSDMLDYFGDDERIWGIAMSMYIDSDIRSQIYKLKNAGKKIFIFTAYDTDDVYEIIDIGGDGLYVDYPDIIPIK